MIALLDYGFVLFHSVLVLFNLTGWAWRHTRRLHLIVISLTLLSWFGLGLFFGWGYCPCTDWHWQVKTAMGETNLPHSYIKYYLDYLTGKDWNPALVDTLTLGATLSSFAMAVGLNLRDHLSGRSGSNLGKF